jgi:hypothetical protein
MVEALILANPKLWKQVPLLRLGLNMAIFLDVKSPHLYHLHSLLGAILSVPFLSFDVFHPQNPLQNFHKKSQSFSEMEIFLS